MTFLALSVGATGFSVHHHLGAGRPFGQLGVAVEHLDLVLLHQEGDAVAQLLGDGARTGDHLGQVEAHALDREAKVLEVAELP